jgi:hypothetical protein
MPPHSAASHTDSGVSSGVRGRSTIPPPLPIPLPPDDLESSSEPDVEQVFDNSHPMEIQQLSKFRFLKRNKVLSATSPRGLDNDPGSASVEPQVRHLLL